MGDISGIRYGVRNCCFDNGLGRQQKKFEIEDETYQKMKKAIKEKEIKDEK